MSSELVHVQANGLRFACLSEGEGPLVLCMHGFPDTARSWDDVRPKIAAKGHRCVTPYMRGYDPTGIPERDAGIETLARDVAALIEALGEEKAVVVGHDWGAIAGYGAASLFPERVDKLVTVGVPHPAALAPTPKRVWGVRHFIAFRLPGAEARFAKDDFAGLEHICKRWSPEWSPSRDELADVRRCFSNPASLHAAFGYYRAFSSSMPKYLRSKIRVPTVVFSGTSDPITVPADYHGAARLFDGPYAVEVTPGGHFLHREHPGVFAERLLPHL